MVSHPTREVAARPSPRAGSWGAHFAQGTQRYQRVSSRPMAPRRGDRQVMTAAEVADHLAIGRTSVYALLNRADGPPVLRIGSQLRVRRADLDAWLDRKVRD